MGLVDDDTDDFLSRARPAVEIINHDLRRQEEHALVAPLGLSHRGACLAGDLRYVSLREPHDVEACFDLLGNKGLGGSHKHDLPWNSGIRGHT